jgi:hypothetical protein
LIFQSFTEEFRRLLIFSELLAMYSSSRAGMGVISSMDFSTLRISGAA